MNACLPEPTNMEPVNASLLKKICGNQNATPTNMTVNNEINLFGHEIKLFRSTTEIKIMVEWKHKETGNTYKSVLDSSVAKLPFQTLDQVYQLIYNCLKNESELPQTNDVGAVYKCFYQLQYDVIKLDFYHTIQPGLTIHFATSLEKTHATNCRKNSLFSWHFDDCHLHILGKKKCYKIKIDAITNKLGGLTQSAAINIVNSAFMYPHTENEPAQPYSFILNQFGSKYINITIRVNILDDLQFQTHTTKSETLYMNFSNFGFNLFSQDE